MYSAAEHEELSRRSLVAQAAAVNRTARIVLRQADLAVGYDAARNDFCAREMAFIRLGLATVVEYLTFLIGLGCIYGIDVLLFGPSAQYAAVLLGGGGALSSVFAKWILPGCFIGVEVLISLKVEKARHDEQFCFGSRAAKQFWIGVGILVALVMPLCALATAQAAATVSEGSASGPMVAVLGIVSFAAHVLVLFGGRIAQDAKTYLGFLLLRGFHEGRTATASHRASGALRELSGHFIGYVHAWRLHTARFSHLPVGPFDRDVVRLLAHQFPDVTFRRGEPSFPVIEPDREHA